MKLILRPKCSDFLDPMRNIIESGNGTGFKNRTPKDRRTRGVEEFEVSFGDLQRAEERRQTVEDGAVEK